MTVCLDCGTGFMFGQKHCSCINEILECEKCGKHIGYYYLLNPEESQIDVRCLECGKKVER